jgi:hypothetical protein
MIISLVSLVMLVSIAFAEDQGMMWGQDWNYCPYCGQHIGPRGGYGTGLGMMGRGSGMMGPGMMGPGMMGSGMMGSGMMGPGMMGPGMMGPGMMGPGMMGPGYWQSEECQKFLNDNAALRRELHNKRFEYSETMRNPKATTESLAKLEKEIRDLQEKVYSKSPQGCWW